jgi:hypothetical protein
VRPFRESKLLVGTTFLLEKKGKVYLEDCEKQRALCFCLVEKTWCRVRFIPVLVFDCVALQLREGKVSNFRAQGYVFFLRAGYCVDSTGFFWYLFFL